MSQARPALAFEVRRESPSESPQALVQRALALVEAGADILVVRLLSSVRQQHVDAAQGGSGLRLLSTAKTESSQEIGKCTRDSLESTLCGRPSSEDSMHVSQWSCCAHVSAMTPRIAGRHGHRGHVDGAGGPFQRVPGGAEDAGAPARLVHPPHPGTSTRRVNSVRDVVRHWHCRTAVTARTDLLLFGLSCIASSKALVARQRGSGNGTDHQQH